MSKLFTYFKCLHSALPDPVYFFCVEGGCELGNDWDRWINILCQVKYCFSQIMFEVVLQGLGRIFPSLSPLTKCIHLRIVWISLRYNELLGNLFFFFFFKKWWIFSSICIDQLTLSACVCHLRFNLLLTNWIHLPQHTVIETLIWRWLVKFPAKSC